VLAAGAASAAGLAAAAGLGSADGSSSASSTLTAAPHELQNFAPGRSSEAHSEHAFIAGADGGGRLVRSCPHPSQSCAPEGSPAPQDGQ
jgi:hypothetical protein